MSEVFLAPRFCGARFDNHGLPVDVMPELTAYKELILAIAKSVWRRNNPDKKRLPQKFADQFELQTKVIAPGSTIPVLERVRSGQLPLPGSEDDFDHARDLFNQALEALASNQPLPSAFPDGLTPYLRDFGRRLRPDEYIVLQPQKDGNGPRYDRQVRESLLLREAQNYIDTFDLVGEIKDWHTDTGAISVWFNGQTLETSYRLSEDEKALVVARIPGVIPIGMKGEGVFGAHARLNQIRNVQEITLLDEEPFYNEFFNSLGQLERLSEGWFGARSRPFTKEELTWLKQYFLELAIRHGIPLPILYPVEEGTVRAEWRLKPMDISAEFDLSSRKAFCHALNLDTDEDREMTLALETHIEVLATFIEESLVQWRAPNA